jgi:putative phosphoesterase
MSDSHRNISLMLHAAEQTKPDGIIHLGDHISDARKLQELFPDALYYMVKGNCDVGADGKDELLLPFGGVRIFAAHGHVYGVKRGLTALSDAARSKGASLAVFGHTHQPLIRQTPGLWLMNPGQMETHGENRIASYGVVTIGSGSLDCGIEYLPV